MILAYHHFRENTAAWSIAEKARSRAFLEQLGLVQLIPHGKFHSDTLEREAQLLNHIRHLEASLRAEDLPSTRRTETAIQLRLMREELTEVLAIMANELPDYVALRRGDVVTFVFLRGLIG